MQNPLNTFQFREHQVRIVLGEEDEPRWVAKDVAAALGYPESSTSTMSKLIAHVPEEWKGRNLIPTPGGMQEMWTLSEQGLYFFLARSDKPAAIPMQKWVAGEVLPSIHKNGAYVSQKAAAFAPEDVFNFVRQCIEPHRDKDNPEVQLEQFVEDTKRLRSLLEDRVLPTLARIEAKPSSLLGNFNPGQAAQLLNAIGRATRNHRSFNAAKRIFPGLFQENTPEQPRLPGLDV